MTTYKVGREKRRFHTSRHTFGENLVRIMIKELSGYIKRAKILYHRLSHDNFEWTPPGCQIQVTLLK